MALALGLPVLLVLGAWGAQHGLAERERARGAALFNGEEAIEARLAGHEEPLPGMATRCSNCHARQPGVTPAGAPSALDAASLLTPRSRRHGPPSRFEADSLCQLLRTGVDPAQVMLPPTMPRYAVTDAQCQALWAFLSTP